MALRKIMAIEGNAVIGTPEGNVNIGKEKAVLNAYCKITNLTSNKNAGRVVVNCVDGENKLIKQYEVPLSTEDNAPNFIKQAYLHLKTLPDWADATDC
jgi:hypothetical protein